MRALAFENSRFTLDLSLAASVNADSEDNPLREGLPDIDYQFELGPQLKFTGFDRLNDDGSHSSLVTAIALRAAFSTDFSRIDSRGAVAGLHVEYNRRNIGPDGRFAIYARGGPRWASEELQDVFYEVAPEYARDGRPAYDAKGGYLGTDIGIGGRWTARRNLWLYGGLAGSSTATAPTPTARWSKSTAPGLSGWACCGRSRSARTRSGLSLRGCLHYLA